MTSLVNPLYNAVRSVLFSTFYRWGTGGIEKLSLKSIAVGAKADIWHQTDCSRAHMLKRCAVLTEDAATDQFLGHW